MSIETKIKRATVFTGVSGLVKLAHATDITDTVYQAMGTSQNTENCIEGMSAAGLVTGLSVTVGLGAYHLASKNLGKVSNPAAICLGSICGMGTARGIYEISDTFVRQAAYDMSVYGTWIDYLFRDAIPAGIILAGIIGIGYLILDGINKVFKEIDNKECL